MYTGADAKPGLKDKGARRGEGRHSARTTAPHLRRKADVCYHGLPPAVSQLLTPPVRRADDKTAADYQLEGGATLHLVLALRGGL